MFIYIKLKRKYDEISSNIISKQIIFKKNDAILILVSLVQILQKTSFLSDEANSSKIHVERDGYLRPGYNDRRKEFICEFKTFVY